MALPTGISDREYQKFEEIAGDVNHRTIAYTLDTPYKKLTETVNQNLKYFGEAKITAALPASDIWRISKYTKQGSIETLEYANEGKFVSIWDLRASYFTAAGLLNSLSTNFDGIDDFVSFGDVFLYDRTIQFSMGFWVKPNNLAAQQCIYSKTTPDGNVYGLNFQITTLGRIVIQARAAGFLNSWTDTTLAVTPGVWNYVVIAFNGGSNMNGFRIYINGVLGTIPGSAVMGGTLLSGQTAMLGSRNGSFNFTGRMDDVSIWDKELTLAEVGEAYNAGAPTNLAFHSAYGNLRHYYRMGDSDIFPAITDNRDAANGNCINMTLANFVSDVP